MSLSRIQLLIITIILLSIGYSAGFQSGKYYGASKELKKQISKLNKNMENK